MEAQVRKVICALDTANLDEATNIVKRLSHRISTFKIGHALTLPHGLDVVNRLQDAGAHRIFLDLKFHDIPNSIALGVREAARRGVWMMTLHIPGGPAMITAAVEEARSYSEREQPLLVGVSVLTSLDEHTLRELGVNRTIEEQMVALSTLGCDCGLDGVVCSVHEVRALRHALGHSAIIVTPGIRLPSSEINDQKRVGDASQALEDGSDYLVVGRALTATPDLDATLDAMGFAAHA
jgi:orotidine-5'-phosphate decarboxylase